MPGTIAVGLDGTEHSLAAADWAATEASHRGSILRLVHAWTWRVPDAPIAMDPEEQQRWATGVLSEAETRVVKDRPGLPVTTQLLATDTVPALVAEAAVADMLVLGSRGHGTLVGNLLGSIALHVLRQATGPVVLVRNPSRGSAPGQPLDEVVVGTQDGEEADPLLGFAFAAAAVRGARVRAVRAWSIPPVFMWSPGSMWLADEAGGLDSFRKERLAVALRPWRERYPQVDVIEHVEIGSAAQVLLACSGRAVLMVVGRHVHGRLDVRRIGSVAHAVLHHAPCPVAVVPHS
ncbi:universal stress protein [Streptomyces netropsis]|uniref:universal stress protein n=1 Tax=Streptomyces netropsis TaxID=55404 RepID=UPI0030CBFAD1